MKHLKTILGIAISAILVYVVLFNPHLGSLLRGEMGLGAALFSDPRIHLEDLETAADILNYWLAGLAVLILIASLFLRAWRWKLIIEQVGPTDFWTVFHAMNAGYLLNNVLPFRAGELLRGIIVGRRSDLPAAATITSVVVERIFDMAGLAVAFGVVLAFFPFPGWIRGAGGIIALAIVVMLIVGIILSHQQERLKAWHERISGGNRGFVIKLREKVLELLEGLSVLKSRSAMIHIAWSTLVLWAAYIFIMQVVMTAFGFTDGTYPLLADMHFIKAGAMTMITALGFAIPSAPGGVGTYHASVLLGLSWFDVPEGMGVIFAAVMHAVNYITLSLAGVLGLWRLKLSFRDVIQTSKEAAEEPDPA
ncbi:flippase-like domain-containing protein [bacterium]|nr:flippase-like domain-containing protein [bacterium]